MTIWPNYSSNLPTLESCHEIFFLPIKVCLNEFYIVMFPLATLVVITEYNCIHEPTMQLDLALHSFIKTRVASENMTDIIPGCRELTNFEFYTVIAIKLSYIFNFEMSFLMCIQAMLKALLNE
jgi:hypothetical protein